MLAMQCLYKNIVFVDGSREKFNTEQTSHLHFFLYFHQCVGKYKQTSLQKEFALWSHLFQDTVD